MGYRGVEGLGVVLDLCRVMLEGCRGILRYIGAWKTKWKLGLVLPFLRGGRMVPHLGTLKSTTFASSRSPHLNPKPLTVLGFRV